jgi:hypothetical protein
MDPWTGPTPTPQQFPYQSSDGLQVLIDAIAGMRTELREVRSNLFSNAGLRMLPNKIASKDFDGTDRTHLGAAGWMLGSDGPGLPSYMGLNGHDIITELIASVADIATLVSKQVAAGQSSAIQTSFGTGLTDADYATATIPVPAGFSQALVMVVVTAGVINSAANADFLFVSAQINGVQSREVFALAGPGASASISTAKSTLVTGLSGGVITCRTRAHSQGNAWGSNAANRAYTEAIATFLR